MNYRQHADNNNTMMMIFMILTMFDDDESKTNNQRPPHTTRFFFAGMLVDGDTTHERILHHQGCRSSGVGEPSSAGCRDDADARRGEEREGGLQSAVEDRVDNLLAPAHGAYSSSAESNQTDGS